MMRRPSTPAEGNLSMLEETLGKTALLIADGLKNDVAPAMAANNNSLEGLMRDMYVNGGDYSSDKPAKTIVSTFEAQSRFNGNGLGMTEPTKLNIFIGAKPTRPVEEEQNGKPVMPLLPESENVIPFTGRTAKLGLTG